MRKLIVFWYFVSMVSAAGLIVVGESPASPWLGTMGYVASAVGIFAELDESTTED